jgi:hypothetical protein
MHSLAWSDWQFRLTARDRMSAEMLRQSEYVVTYDNRSANIPNIAKDFYISLDG